MEFGYLNNRFYIDVPSCRWEVKDFRTEVYRRAVNLYEQNNKLMLGMSTGLDSQIVLLSCLDQGIPIECVFMYYQDIMILRWVIFRWLRNDSESKYKF